MNVKTAALQQNDIDAVVRNMPPALRYTLVRYADEACVSGSFIANTIRREVASDSDIDVFCRARSLITDLAAAYIHKNRDYCSSNKYRTLSTTNGITLWRESDRPVQFVCPNVWTEPTDVIADFDYTIAQAAIWWAKEGDEWRGICCKEYYMHVASRRLMLNDERKAWTFNNIRRMLKYVGRGYVITDEEANKLIRKVYQAAEVPMHKNGNNYVWDAIDDSQSDKDVDLRLV